MGVLPAASINTKDLFKETRLRKLENGCVSRNFASSSSNINLNLLPSFIERATQDILCNVHPTQESEERRKAIINYVQRLISDLGSEVFPFGSVPLKTYLPDGDIDLTALCIQSDEHALANNIRSVLEQEEQNSSAEFEVKDIQYINAEVKLIKCIVQNLPLDISFSQLGGLSKLCFLEQIDRLIGKDHLFKRSVIFVKTWCYYESRILSANHGLLSTYALETLVMYIFHLFHSSLSGPLAVLHRFLDYYSKFDWDKYCISLSGPAYIAALPEIVVEKPENAWDELLFYEECLRRFVNAFSIPREEPETKTFLTKHLNIIDPLNESNNLGRSVSKGNFYRIRSAFTFGAEKLGQILSLPEDNIADEIYKFFSNTLDRHGSGYRLDIPDLPSSGSMVESPKEVSNGTKSEAFPLLGTKEDKQRRRELSKSKIKGSTKEMARPIPNIEVGTSLRSHRIQYSLSDLSGDYENHFSSMVYVRSCQYGSPSSEEVMQMPGEMRRYFPGMNNYCIGGSSSLEWGTYDQLMKQNNDGPFTLFDGRTLEKGVQDSQGAEVTKYEGGLSHSSSNPLPLENLEFGSYKSIPLPSMEACSSSDSIPSHASLLKTSPTKSALESSENQKRIDKSYHLEDDKEFPPLFAPPRKPSTQKLESENQRREMQSLHLKDETEFPPLLGRRDENEFPPLQAVRRSKR